MPVSEFFKRLKKKNNKTVNFSVLNGFLLAIIGAGLIYYVVGVNDLVVKGFELQELKSYSQSLRKENGNYKDYATSLRSYNNLAKRAEKLGMIETEKIDYVRKQSAVALRSLYGQSK